MPEHRQFLPRLLWVKLAALLLITAWQTLPLVQSVILGQRAEPRTVTPRRNLAEAEPSTIELFEAARDMVVYIATTTTFRASSVSRSRHEQYTRPAPRGSAPRAPSKPPRNQGPPAFPTPSAEGSERDGDDDRSRPANPL